MRFIRKEASARHSTGVVGPPARVSSEEALRHCRNYLSSCQTSRIQLPTFLPIGADLLAAPLTAQKRHRCYEGSDSRRSHTVRRVPPLTLPCLPNIQPPTTLWARVSFSQSSQRTRRVLRPRLRHE